MIINTNMASLNTIRQLGVNEKNTQNALAKLSSGLRINTAADDAAGLAISEKMRGQISGLKQASANAQNGISMVSTAEGALNETTSILQRMRELAVQASNDTNTSDDRQQIQAEMNQLTSEVNRIGNTTEFNTQKLLKGITAPVVETALTKSTVTAGVTGVAAGSVSALSVDASSVKGVNSQATVQASRAEATGGVSSMRTTTASIKGAVSSVTLSNGVVFQSKTMGAELNGRDVVIEQNATADRATTVDYANGVYTFTIGQTAGGVSLATNRGELYNELNNALQTGTGNSTKDAELAKLSLQVPTGTDTGVTNVAANGTMANGRAETNGVYEFDLNNKFEEAGDTIAIGGQTFTSVLNNATAADGEFAVGAQSQLTGGLAVDTDTPDLSSVTGTATINVAGRDFTISQDNLNKITTGVAAKWDTGTMTALTDGQSGTLVFNGVTLTINAASANTNTIATDTDAKTITLSLDSDDALAAQMTDIKNALTQYKTDGGSEFADFTFASNTATDGIKITGSNTGISDLAITAGGNVTITNAGSTDQQSNGDGVLGVGNSLDDRITVINDATDSEGIKLSTVADVVNDGGAIKIVAKESQPDAITWTTNGDITNRQQINEAFGMNTIAMLDGNDRVEPTADLDGIKASWDTGDIDVSTLADTEQASYSFGGVTVIVHDSTGLADASAASVLGNALNFNDTSLQAGDTNAKIEVLSNSTVHMWFDAAAAADDVEASASFADNLAAAFNAAKYYNSTSGDVDGTGAGALANIDISDEKGTQNDTIIAGKNMGRLVFTDSEANGATNNSYEITTTALANKGAITNDTTAKQQKAVWDSGDITAVATGDTKTLTFGGVTVNITGVVTADLAGANATVNAKYDISDNTINLTIDTSVANTAGLFATALGTALNDAKTKAPLSSTDFNNFTFAGAAGTTGAAATSGHLTITRDPGEALQSTYEIGGTLNIGYVGGATQTSTGAGRAGMIGTDTISNDTTATFTVDGRDYSISNADLKAAFNENKGANTPADVLNLVSTRALDANGNALSTAASITMDSNNGLVITSLTEGDASKVQFAINGTSGSAQVARALGISDGSKDGGESVVSESPSATSQADSLVNAINANSVLGARFTAVNNSGTVTLTEKTDQATGVNLSSAVVAGAGTDDKLIVTNTDGMNLKKVTIQQAVTTGNVSAATNKIDTNFQLTASAGGSDSSGGGTELNGLKVAFSGLTSATSTNVTASFDADTFTINVTGTLANAAGNQADIASKIQTAINSELTANGFGTTLTATQGSTAGNGVGILAAYNNKVLEFGKAGDANAVMGQVAIASNDTMVVSQTNGNLTINLANTSAYKNTADAIQQAVQTLGTNGYTAGVDFSKYQFTTQGNWDTDTLGNSIKKGSAALVGGTEETKGSYSFDVTKTMQAGDIVELNGKAFKAVAKNPNIANNEFQVVAGDTLADQAVRLADSVSAAFSDYTVTTQGSKVILTQNTADGVDMSEKDLSVRATGTQGEYTVAADNLLTNGAKFVLDGQEITVSDKENNVGYADGTAIKQADTVADQTKALADAINSNANLKTKYTASVAADGSLDLKQTELYATATAPVVSTKSTDKGDFQASFQVGANSGQSMAIDFKDMRSASLGISGDGSASTVQASNGTTASYVTVSNVTNGTDNNNVEYSLDVSTADKATAAISVLDDAINAVSTERAKMGAYQNRLEHTINNLGTASQNITSAEANIRDVDMAAEMTDFQKNNILQQAAQAMLAQANQQPQGVLQLLR